VEGGGEGCNNPGQDVHGHIKLMTGGKKMLKAAKGLEDGKLYSSQKVESLFRLITI